MNVKIDFYKFGKMALITETGEEIENISLQSASQSSNEYGTLLVGRLFPPKPPPKKKIYIISDTFNHGYEYEKNSQNDYKIITNHHQLFGLRNIEVVFHPLFYKNPDYQNILDMIRTINLV